MRTPLALAACLALALALPSCVVVPRYAREWVSNPAMDGSSDMLAQRSLRKLHGTREAAAGGDGLAAGGGCACGQ
jgi:hypothetical protein